MFRSITIGSAAVVLLLVAVTASESQSLAKATMLREHKLTESAKQELINVVWASAVPGATKAKALDLLATMAFEEANYQAAATTWKMLIEQHPSAPEAAAAKERLKLLGQALISVSDGALDDAKAESYIRHGDFWSKEREQKFMIDSSWLPKLDMAVYWYDKVIKDFAGTQAASRAYEHKLQAILGWKDPGRYGDSYGLQKSPEFYLPQFEETFRAFERDFPEAASLQAFRYQLAQAFWTRDDAKAKQIFNEVIEKDSGRDTFYVQAAQKRLEYWRGSNSAKN